VQQQQQQQQHTLALHERSRKLTSSSEYVDEKKVLNRPPIGARDQFTRHLKW
jgi:hypothetical protein